MAELSPQIIDEFKQLYTSEYGGSLDDLHARKFAMSLIDLVQTVLCYKPPQYPIQRPTIPNECAIITS